jgi:hypothetical protein
MTENVNQELDRNIRYGEWANEWEEEMKRGQLTHIRNHPSVDLFVKEGQKAVPFIIERMQQKRLWFIPLEKIITEEFGEEIEPAEQFVDSPEVREPDYIEAKFEFLEGHRLACLDWAKKNGYLPKEKG